VASNADFDHPVIVKTDKYAIKTNAWQCDVNLDYLTTYYWKVKAISESTSSAWSSTGIFTTEPASTKAPEITPSVQLSSPVNRPETIPTSTPSMLTAPVPVIPSQVPVKPAPISSPPYNITEVPVFSQSINLPAWAIYLMFGLLAIVFLALVIVLAIVLKIRRF
jgi:hypothetical protein